LKIVENLKNGQNIILSKENLPIAVISNILDYEKKNVLVGLKKKKIKKNNAALVIVAAKNCDENIAVEAIAQINELLKSKNNPYSKIIFVYGKKTEKYLNDIKVEHLYTIENEKFNFPLITSIKCAMSGLLNENNFVITFISRAISKSDLLKVAYAANTSKKGIIIALKDNKPAHPISFSISYKKYFLSTRKELGVPYLIKKFKNDIEYI